MTRIKHPQWRDDHEYNKYPFSDEATLVNDVGSEFQKDIFLDAAFYVSGANVRGYISRVFIDDDEATIYVGDAANSEIASATFSIVDPPEGIRFTDSYDRPSGLIVSTAEKLEYFQSWSPGNHTFTEAQAGLATAVWFPTPEVGLRGVQADDGQIVTGDVYLVGDDGVYLSCTTEDLPASCSEAASTKYVIRVDILGDPLWRRKECAPGFFSTPRFLETVTFQKGGRTYACGPGSYGDIKLFVGNTAASDTILRIRPETGGLRIEAVGERLEDIR